MGKEFVRLLVDDNSIKVAAKALKDTRKGKDISIYGIYTKFSHLLAKLLPQKMIMEIWLNQQKLK